MGGGHFPTLLFQFLTPNHYSNQHLGVIWLLVRVMQVLVMRRLVVQGLVIHVLVIPSSIRHKIIHRLPHNLNMY